MNSPILGSTFLFHCWFSGQTPPPFDQELIHDSSSNTSEEPEYQLLPQAEKCETFSASGQKSN